MSLLKAKKTEVEVDVFFPSFFDCDILASILVPLFFRFVVAVVVCCC